MGGLFSAIGSLFGGAPNNAGFTAQSANVLNPTGIDQANQAYGNVQSAQGNALNAQGATLNALANSQGGVNQQQQLANALAAQNGLANQSSVFNQLQGVANGSGPNPAQAMLNQATGQNVANQASLAAGQRGAGSNIGLLERQAAQTGANTQQNAVGQAANLQANQSLNALGQLGGVANQQVANQIGGVQGLNQALQNQAGLTQSSQGLAQNQQSLNQQEQQNILNSINAQNSANIQNVSQQNAANAGLASTNANNTAKAIGAVTNAAGSALGLAMGGEVGNPKLNQVPKSDRFPGKAENDHLEAISTIYHNKSFNERYPHKGYFDGGSVEAMKKGGKVPGKPVYAGNNEKNDVVPAMLSKGEIVLPNTVTQSRDPVGAAAQFVAMLEAKKGKGQHAEDFKGALKRAVARRKNK